jgi:hypothetical protein
MESQNPPNRASTSEAPSEGWRRSWRPLRQPPLARVDARIGRTKRKKKPEVSEISISEGGFEKKS